MIFKAALVVIIVSITALTLKKNNENISVLVLIGGSIIVFTLIISAVINIVGSVEGIFEYTGLDSAYLKVLLKCLAICLITQFASDVCEDSGHKVLSEQIILAGKITIIAISMPIFKAILEVIIGLINK